MMHSRVPNSVRRAIYRRDGYACALCGDPRALTIHHVWPRSAGGGNSPTNLITLCRYCHALAHGLYLNDMPEGGLVPADVEQAAVEYLSDMYMTGYEPRLMYDYDDPVVLNAVLDDLERTWY